MISRSTPTNAGALLTIDLDAIGDNWRALKEKAGRAECAAVVKADAYGLGARKVAPALYLAGCRHFFVAHLTEAIELRPTLAADAVIYVLHGAHPGAEMECVTHGLVPVLNSLPQLAAWRRLAERLDRVLPAILQIDTGMARLGLAADELERLAADRGALTGIELKVIMSHLVSAEDQANPINRAQLERFRAALARLPAASTHMTAGRLALVMLLMLAACTTIAEGLLLIVRGSGLDFMQMKTLLALAALLTINTFGIAWLDARVGLGLRMGLRVAPFDADVRRYVAVAAPLMLGLSLAATDEWYDRWFGGLLAAGTVAHLSFARRPSRVTAALPS